MRADTSLIPYVLLVAGIAGILLIIAASTDAIYRWDPPNPRASQAGGTTPTPLSNPSPVSFTPTPQTPASTASPRTTPTPTALSTTPPTPVAISPPFVSSAGALAYVESGTLTVVEPSPSKVTRVAEGVIHSAQALIWSPGGRRLLYTTGSGDSQKGSTGERRTFHIWDSRSGETLQVERDVPGFPSDAANVRSITWSPEGTHILFQFSPDASVEEAWVLDTRAMRGWRLPRLSVGRATWIDESTILCSHGKESPAHLLNVGPPARALTQTVPLRGTYVLSPDRDHVASFREKPGEGQKLQILSLPGHVPLSLSEQPTVTASGKEPLWSADGRWVAYGAEAITSQDQEGPHTLLVDTSGTSPPRTFQGLIPVAWSPDSRLLAGFGCPNATCTLGLIDVVSAEVTPIVSAKDLVLWDLAWSPGGVYLLYSVSSSDIETDMEGLLLWNRATGEHLRLVPGNEAHPLTDLQWGPDSCSLYAAQRENRAGVGLAPSAIWGVGPAWRDQLQIAPELPKGVRSLREALSRRESGRVALSCPDQLLDGRRLIAYYGTPQGPGLGILGRHSVTETLRLLKEQVHAYRDLDPAVHIIPTFHMVTTIADDFAGPEGDYNHRVPHETIRYWIDSIEKDEGWSILDVQLGRADLTIELDRVDSLLQEPNVHLAVDPEFIAREGQVPGQDLGQITGPQINLVQARLDRIARRIGHRKMLVIHQFDDRMIEQKGMILDFPLVDLVWDADGFGSPGSKTQDYDQYKMETGFEFGGFKLFYKYDEPVMTPEQVLSLDPTPRLVIYQ